MQPDILEYIYLFSHLDVWSIAFVDFSLCHSMMFPDSGRRQSRALTILIRVICFLFVLDTSSNVMPHVVTQKIKGKSSRSEGPQYTLYSGYGNDLSREIDGQSRDTLFAP